MGQKRHFPAVAAKKTPARLELRRVGVMALLWLVVSRLLDSSGISDLVG